MNDKDIERRYRAASTEQPSAAADAAILAFARAAAASVKTAAETCGETRGEIRGEIRPAANATMLRRWRAPLGLAASLVLAVGIVSRVQVEEQAGTAPGSVPVAAPASSSTGPVDSSPASAPTNASLSVSEAASANRASAPAIPAPATPRMPPALPRASDASNATEAKNATPQAFPAQISGAQEPTPAQVRAAIPPAAAPAEPAAKPDALKKHKALADSVVTADAAARKELAPPAPPASSSPAPSAAFPETSAAAPAMTPSVPPPSAPLARNAAAAVSAEMQRDDAVRSRALGPLQGRSLPAGNQVLTEAAEALLSPDQWLRRIVDARRTGRDDEADASLKRFITKYPSLPVPPEARRAGER